MFAYDGETTVPKIMEIECLHTGIVPSTYTITLNASTEPTTLPPDHWGNRVTRYVPPVIEKNPGLAKKKRRQANKQGRPAWRL